MEAWPLGVLLRYKHLSLVRNGEFLSAFATAGSQNSASVGGRHSLTKSVLIHSLSARWLKCSLHLSVVFEFAKVRIFLDMRMFFSTISCCA